MDNGFRMGYPRFSEHFRTMCPNENAGVHSKLYESSPEQDVGFVTTGRLSSDFEGVHVSLAVIASLRRR